MKKTTLAFWSVAVLFILGYAVYWRSAGPASTPVKETGERKYKIGILSRGDSYRPGVEGFLSKMEKLGYKENENVSYFLHYVKNLDEIPDKITGFIKEEVDVIFTYSTPATIEAYRLTKTIPIVFGSMGDPLASGVIDSLQRPGRNVTGISSLSAPLAAKRLELLKEALPSIKKVAFPMTQNDIPGQRSLEVAYETATRLEVSVIPYYITSDRDVKATALAIKRKDVDGIVISSDSAVWANLATYVEQAKKEKLPFAVFDKDMVEKGGLVGYGPDYFISGEQAAVYVDRILRGENPADLPIDTPRKLLIILNLATARDIGFTFPEALLQRADLLIGKTP